jgi:hypothetical protein
MLDEATRKERSKTGVQKPRGRNINVKSLGGVEGESGAMKRIYWRSEQ